MIPLEMSTGKTVQLWMSDDSTGTYYEALFSIMSIVSMITPIIQIMTMVCMMAIICSFILWGRILSK